MKRKIAMLRGINVGGKRKILMADLRAMFEKMEFANISTYIQSGNVFFDTTEACDNLELAQRIEQAIAKTFSFDVPVIIREPPEIAAAIHNNPFYKNDVDINRLYLTFLKQSPTTENQQKTASYNYAPDQFVIDGKEIFIHYDGKSHQSKLTNNFFEKKLKVNATTRNWKTVLKLLELSK